MYVSYVIYEKNNIFQDFKDVEDTLPILQSDDAVLEMIRLQSG